MPVALAGVWLLIDYPYGLALFVLGASTYGALKGVETRWSKRG